MATKKATRKTTAKQAAPAGSAKVAGQPTAKAKQAPKNADRCLSQIDAAAKVLAEAGEPMNCKDGRADGGEGLMGQPGRQDAQPRQKERVTSSSRGTWTKGSPAPRSRSGRTSVACWLMLGTIVEMLG